MKLRRLSLVLLTLALSACGAELTVARAAASPTEPGPAQERALVWTASVELDVDTAEQPRTIAALAELARSMDGYPEEQSPTVIVMRVPAARLEEALASIAAHGQDAQRSVNAEDVTLERADLDVRIENLRRLQIRLRELAQQGTSVAELLEVERELARVTGELEAMTQRRTLLGQRIALASIRVTLTDAPSPGPVGWLFYGVFVGVKWLFVWD